MADYNTVLGYCNEMNARREVQAHQAFANFLLQIEGDYAYDRIPQMPNIPLKRIPVNNSPDNNPSAWEDADSTAYVIPNPFTYFLDINGYLCMTWPGTKHVNSNPTRNTPWGIAQSVEKAYNEEFSIAGLNKAYESANFGTIGRASKVDRNTAQSTDKIKTSNKR